MRHSPGIGWNDIGATESQAVDLGTYQGILERRFQRAGPSGLR